MNHMKNNIVAILISLFMATSIEARTLVLREQTVTINFTAEADNTVDSTSDGEGTRVTVHIRNRKRDIIEEFYYELYGVSKSKEEELFEARKKGNIDVSFTGMCGVIINKTSIRK